MLSLSAGETGVYEIKLTTVDADLHEWQFGSLSWVSPQNKVRSPIAARPVLFAAPLEAFGIGTSGDLQLDVYFGYTGPYTTTVAGLVAPKIFHGNVTNGLRITYPDPPPPLGSKLPDNIWRSPVNAIVTSETDTYLRVALFDENTTGDDDLDLYVYYCPPLLPCESPFVSGNFDSNEQVDILLHKAGNYIVDVHGFNTEGADTDFDLYVWTVGTVDNLGNLTVTAPTEAISGDQDTVTITWEGLETHRDGLELKAHLGTITHDNESPDADSPLEVTLIEVRH